MKEEGRKTKTTSRKKPKPKVAFYEFADCEGCQLQVANLGGALLALTEVVDIVNFREIMSETGEDYEVLIVEGSVASKHDEERLKKIAVRAKVVVALGACAATGGVNNLKNFKPLEEQKKIVYGAVDPVPDALPTRPIDEVIKVDYYINGCPIYGPEFLKVMECVLMGRPYLPSNHPVCVECKQNENVCLFEKGLFCMGPVTRAGCNSWCTNNGGMCYGCRGLIDNPASGAQQDILAKYGLTVEEILSRFTIYGGCVKDQIKYAKDTGKK